PRAPAAPRGDDARCRRQPAGGRARRAAGDAGARVMQICVARPTRDLERATCFYRLLVLPVIASFEDHDGYSGVVFGVPDASRQLELVLHEGEVPAPTREDQLVLYLGSAGGGGRAGGGR